MAAPAQRSTRPTTGALRAFVDDGLAALPEIDVGERERERLVEHVAGRIENDPEPEVALDKLAADEIVLCWAVASGDTAAIRVFEARYFAPLRPVLRRMSLCDDDMAEIEQQLRVRLLVASGGDPPAVLRYAGRGELRGLARVAAVRAGVTLLRGRDRSDGDDWLEELSSPDDDPRLAQMKSRYRAELRQAFEEAARRLASRERSVLRLHLVRKLGIDEISRIYGVHRATAARWIDRSRRRLGALTRQVLARRWQIFGDDVGEVVALIQSRLELSMERLLDTVERRPARYPRRTVHEATSAGRTSE